MTDPENPLVNRLIEVAEQDAVKRRETARREAIELSRQKERDAVAANAARILAHERFLAQKAVAGTMRDDASAVMQLLNERGVKPPNQAGIWLLEVGESYDWEDRQGMRGHEYTEMVNYQRRGIGIRQDGRIVDIKFRNKQTIGNDRSHMYPSSPPLLPDEQLAHPHRVIPGANPEKQPLVAEWRERLFVLGRSALDGRFIEP